MNGKKKRREGKDFSTGEGTGLGLLLSYDSITKDHSGTLTVEGQEGAGATFVITLPTKELVFSSVKLA